MKILVAEDDLAVRSLLRAALVQWGYEVLVASDGVEAWHMLQAEDPPRLAILDWLMPGVDGLEVCRRVRQSEQEPYIYIILLTGKGGKEDVIKGMKAGADDYLSKPFNPHELQVRLRAGKRILDLQAELIAAREALREQATHDALTGLWNRRAILDLLNQELVRAGREGRSVAVVIADLDHFKRVNDTYGHLVGDAVLRETARRIRASLRPYDAIGRFGGEEFLIVLPGCDESSGVKQAERLRERIGGEVMEASEARLSVTSSFGVAVSDSKRAADADALIRVADAALYRAKWGGRNRVMPAGPEDMAVKAPAANDAPPPDRPAP
ncbi:MAG: diguanylate cyclase [Candidatus Methylomirabilia bacterium]